MRRYEDNFNEEYERGFRAGRREALRELNESNNSTITFDEASTFLNKYATKSFSLYKDKDREYVSLQGRLDNRETHSVTFVFDENEKLERIEVSISGIWSSSEGSAQGFFTSEGSSHKIDRIKNAIESGDKYKIWIENNDTFKEILKGLESYGFKE